MTAATADIDARACILDIKVILAPAVFLADKDVMNGVAKRATVYNKTSIPEVPRASEVPAFPSHPISQTGEADWGRAVSFGVRLRSVSATSSVCTWNWVSFAGPN